MNILDRFSKNTQIPNFMKIHPVGVTMFHADGRTDIIKLIVSFCNFASAPKNHSGKPFVTFSLSPHIQVFSSSGSISNGKCKKTSSGGHTKDMETQKSKQRQDFSLLYITYHNFRVTNNVWQHKSLNMLIIKIIII
jgi:hypothetical protein